MQSCQSNNAVAMVTPRKVMAPETSQSHRATWDQRFELLRKLHEQGEDVNLSQSTTMDGFSIGSWIARQRQDYRQGRLGSDKTAKLDSIGLVWSPPTVSDIWETYYALLVKLQQAGKSFDMRADTIIEGKEIGLWIGHQRKYYAEGILSAAKIGKLEAIGFGWEGRQESRWDANFAILQKHHDAGKDVNVWPTTFLRTTSMGRWIEHQRRDYKLGHLSAERIEKLSKIGFRWSESHSCAWEKHYSLLEKRHAAGEEVNLPAETIIDTLKIGAWSKNQRNAHRAGKLSEERIARLQTIGFVFEPVKSEWERNFGILKQLHLSGNDVNLPTDAVVEGINIGTWINRQRYKCYAKGKLSPERTALLESIGIKWSLRD